MGDPSGKVSRERFYERIGASSLTPLWSVLDQLVPETPTGGCAPALWRFEEIRPFLMEAGELISAEEAQRRVLILENPQLRGKSRITSSLYAGLQLLLPGEIAPAHRHSQSALRMVIEGSDAFTAVNGERATMNPGDLILTPSWTWHDHGSETDHPVIWLDALDIPIVEFFDAGFCEQHSEKVHPPTRPEGDAPKRYGANLLPVDYQPGLSSPVFHYPYANTREALLGASRAEQPDPWHGHRMRYTNPATGGHALPTIASFLQYLPAGLETRPYRATDATVYLALEGAGTTFIGEQRFAWHVGDVFVVPSWAERAHVAQGDAVLFSYSDRAVQERLGLWREQKV